MGNKNMMQYACINRIIKTGLSIEMNSVRGTKDQIRVVKNRGQGTNIAFSHIFCSDCCISVLSTQFYLSWTHRHRYTGHSKEKSLNITLLGFLSPCCMTSCTFLH